MPQPIEPVQSEKRSRSVRGAAAETGLGRQVFLQRDGKPAENVRPFGKELRCLKDQVASVRRDAALLFGKRPSLRIRHAEEDPGQPGLFKRQHVVPSDGLHDHADLVIAVGALSGNVQKKIQFCRCLKRQFIHGLKMAAPCSHRTAGRNCRYRSESSVKD